MAWDALQGQFQKKKTPDEEDKGLWGERASQGGPSAGGNSTPSIVQNGGFGGTGGSAGNSGSASFVNYGTLYGANEEKAKGMANNVYRGAETAAEKAKGSLQNAQNQFNNAAQQGTAKGTVGGAHGTRIDNYGAASPAAAGATPGYHSGNDSAGWKEHTARVHGYDAGRAVPTEDQGSLSQDLQGEGTRGLRSGQPGAAAGGATTAGASRYGGLFGQGTAMYGPTTTSDVVNKDSLKDYHASVDLLGAKSGAGQGYTGPKSIEDQMGAGAYGDLAAELKKAQDQVNQTKDAGGLAEALGYTGGVQSSGNAALDAGLTQTAGQSNFKKLRERYSGLNDSLAAAQADSLKTAAGSTAISEANAKQWQDLLAEYDKENSAPKDDGAIRIGAVGPTLGNAADAEAGHTNADDTSGTGKDNFRLDYGGTTKDGSGGQNGLWPSGVGDGIYTYDASGLSPDAQSWQEFWSTVPEATKDYLKTLTAEERQAWADAEWAKLKEGK